MVNKDINFNENILVKVDQNNLVYIDPNSVIDNNNQIHPRGVYPENFVIYANLEAEIIPRTTLTSDNEKSTLVSIASNNINFLNNKSGQDYDTAWTDVYTNVKPKSDSSDNNQIVDNFNSNDKTGQSFGIDSIQVVIKGANAIPYVTINFIDVRGKTLFESPENSPYQAFFHIPWPIFYLTLKGYYGKAIRYRLHLVKLTTKYNDSSGNFDTTATFVGSTFAFLNDIPLKAMLNCPYMYMVETVLDDGNNNTETIKKVSKSSKGYAILKNVYSEYKRKGLIEKNFPVKTLRELIVIAQSIDKILEKEILNNVLDSKVFVGLNELDNNISYFRRAVFSWSQKNLSNNPISVNDGKYFNFKDTKNVDNNKKLFGNLEGGLDYIINNNNKKIKESTAFANEIVDDTKKKKYDGREFKYEKIFTKPVNDINAYLYNNNGTYVVAIEKLIEDIDEAYKIFSGQRDKLINQIEQEMNEIVVNGGKDNTKGFGFKPTIRNIFAVILANAEVYIRLMKDVHTKAFIQGPERAKKIIKNLSTETKQNDLPIYPWPEIKKNAQNKKNKVIAYPGDKDLIGVLKSDNPIYWPEVDFVENYVSISTNKEDTNTDKEGTENSMLFQFDDDGNYETNRISTLDYVGQTFSYIDSIPSAFLYEIWERANFYTFVDSFNSETLNELSKIEFENIEKTIKQNDELITILKNNITDLNAFKGYLYVYSPYERHPYYLDNLPTTPYLKSAIENSFKIDEFVFNNDISKSTQYVKTNQFLLNYTAENYRKDIYPFNSPTYLSYINKQNSSSDEFKFQGNLFVDTSNGFITSKFTTLGWFKSGYGYSNFFYNNIKIGNSESNILNTTFFHNQLFYDFNKPDTFNKYAGSAYLLLNSLPYVDLDNEINLSDYETTLPNIRLSSLFREIGASHYVPYYLICKWGAIYHRYKNYIQTGVDILEGCLTANNNTKSIDSEIFFNNKETNFLYTSYTANNNTIILNNDTTKQFDGDVSVHPFYDAIFHQVVNNYTHYIVSSGDTSFSDNVTNFRVIMRKRNPNLNNLNYWTSLVDNSKFDATSKYYTLLPCDGNQTTFTPLETNSSGLQKYYKLIWDDINFEETYENKKFYTHEEYNQSINGVYSINDNNKKVLDLIATFSPAILDDFEFIFQNFASQKINDINYNKRFNNVDYYQFQELLKDIVTIENTYIKNTYDLSKANELDKFLNEIKTRQKEKLSTIAEKIFKQNNFLKLSLGNPKELDKYVLYGFTNVNTENTIKYNTFNINDITDKNKNYIKLYLGEDLNNYYQNFFVVNDIQLNESNILTLRPIIQIYAGYVQAGNLNTKEAFKEYLVNQIIKNISTNKQNGSDDRLTKFLSFLIQNFPKLKIPEKKSLSITSGYNNDAMKLELYNYFKSFNDKWAAGNSLGQRLLLEEFLFLDKANKDIGDDFYINIDKLLQLGNPKNDKQNLYGVISMIIEKSGIDMRPLPSYINFYSNKTNTKGKITPSKTVAHNLFGTFLDVDYQDSTPKIILQLVGNTSKHLDILNKNYKFNDDSFYMGNTNNHPLIYSLPSNFDVNNLIKSNRAVAFEVNFGDQNQGIFKGVSLDQASIKNTTESFVVLENIAKSESGAGAYNVDIGLFNYYRQASYTCDVTSMGNAMIQPTMFFYLNNIPMFRGSYWITEVTHSVKGNSFTTTFRGTRIPNSSLPDPKDSFVSSYRVLFDRLMRKVLAKVKNDTTEAASTVKSVIGEDNKTYQTDIVKLAKNEDWLKIRADKVGFNKYGIGYNGKGMRNYVQLVKYKFGNEEEKEWLRAAVVELGFKNYPIEENYNMVVASKIDNVGELKWSEISNTSSEYLFYSMNFNIDNGNPKITANEVAKAVTTFVNPEKNKTIKVEKFSITGAAGSRKVNGPVDVGPNNGKYGVGMSRALMQKLELNDGDIVYFDMV